MAAKANGGNFEPIRVYPGSIVENVYPVPGTEDMAEPVPDLESQRVMSKYCISRLIDEDPQVRIVWEKAGLPLPMILKTYKGDKPIYKTEKNGWIISPRASAIVMLGSAVCSVAYPAIMDAYDEVRQATHSVYRLFDPLDSNTSIVPRGIPIGGETKHIKITENARNNSGSAVVNPSVINTVKKQLRLNADDLISITITGRSSDDFGTPESLGIAETSINDYSDDRANSYKDAIEKVVSDDVEIKTATEQSVLTQEEIDYIQKIVERAGYKGKNGIINAINSVNAGQENPKYLEDVINKYFSDKRGVEIDMLISEKDITTTTVYDTYQYNEVDNPPEDPDRDYNPWFIPLIPIPRLRRYLVGYKPKNRLGLGLRRRYIKPKLIEDPKDMAWIRLRPEAKQEDGTLVDNPWAYTRKYEYLLRENRIKKVLSAEFLNNDGVEKTLRIMFVDAEPDTATIESFSDLLRKFSSMQNGELADKVSAIFVYPTEHAGRWHSDPKKVALEIDKQCHDSILGTYTYILDLVELHMPATCDPEELTELLQSFDGPAWTLAHEVAGHGTDETGEKLKISEVKSRDVKNAHIIKGDSRRRFFKNLHLKLKSLPKNILQKKDSIEYDITYPVIDNNGEIVTMHARVQEGDPRLNHATTSNIVGYRNTHYADYDDSEDYAETAASVTTGISVPYKEAYTEIDTLTTDDGKTANFAKGYYPDNRAQNIFTQNIGATKDKVPVEFKADTNVNVTLMDPSDDQLIREHSNRVKRLATLTEDIMVAILARITKNDSRT